MEQENISAMRQSVRFLYDMQKLRIQSSNRASADTVILDAKHRKHLDEQKKNLKTIERKELYNIRKLLKEHPIWTEWLEHQRGCGPTIAGIIISEIDIRKAPTVSALWSFCGLAVDTETGQAVRMKRGEKARFNPWLKSKLIKVLGDCLIKSNSPWRKIYDDYKHRKQNTLIDKCMLCNGSGTFRPKKQSTKSEDEDDGEDQNDTCSNCNGTGGPAPWGQSNKHRHNAAIRYMIKQFLEKMWLKWRELEGLQVTESYAVAVLGRKHGDHGGMGISPMSPLLH